jgi:hypothetical protein
MNAPCNMTPRLRVVGCVAYISRVRAASSIELLLVWHEQSPQLPKLLPERDGCEGLVDQGTVVFSFLEERLRRTWHMSAILLD